MAGADMFEMKIVWPYTEPNSVVVSGTFNKWAHSLHLTKTPTGFEATVKVPWNEKVKYKFIVDGSWRLRNDQPTEMDPGGYINNVYTTPPKPESSPAAPAQPSNTKDVGTNGHAANGVAPSEGQGAGIPQLLSDLASTIAARDGTSSALEYVASGIGAAVHSVVGVDPINSQKIAIPTPKPDGQFVIPGQDKAEMIDESASSPVAPIVPIMIVPVNAPENNTIPRSPPPETVFATPLPPPEMEKEKVPEPTIEEPTVPELPVEEPTTPVLAEPVLERVEEPSTHSTVPVGEEAAPTVVELATVDTTATEEPAPPAEEAPKVTEPVVEEEKAAPTAVPAPVVDAVKAEDPTAVPAVEEVVAEVKKDETTTPDIPAALEAKTPVSDAALAAPVPAPAESTPIPSVPASPALNGVKEEPIATAPTTNGKTTPPPAASAPSAPSTPVKQRFPSSSSTSPSSTTTKGDSPASSRFGSVKRRKRDSFLGKIKKIFHHHDKDEEKQKEKEKATK